VLDFLIDCCCEVNNRINAKNDEFSATSFEGRSDDTELKRLLVDAGHELWSDPMCSTCYRF